MNSELETYIEEVKKYLETEIKYKRYKKQGINEKHIRELLSKEYLNILYVPKKLYHGSQLDFKEIKAQESTQKGQYVYATDNPILAMMFSIFKHSSEVRFSINEYIENEEYKVSYYIDERKEGALEKSIKNKYTNIYICKGDDFFKKIGPQFILREWISKENHNIVPIDKITVNVEEVLNGLSNLNISKYKKAKDIQTVIDLMCNNYPFQLGTQKKTEIKNMILPYVEKEFKEQIKLASLLKEDIDKIMDSENTMEENIKESRLFSEKFYKNEKGIKKIDIKKLNNYINSRSV